MAADQPSPGFITGFVTSTVPVSRPTYVVYDAQQTSPPYAVDNQPVDLDDNVWDGLPKGTKAAVVLMTIIGVVIIAVFCLWFFCGCCGYRNKRRGMAPNGTRMGVTPAHTNPPNTQNPTPDRGHILPMHAIQNRGSRTGHTDIALADAPPPTYEESTPPQHQTLAGGVPNNRDEEDGVISDGKTPLSEIAFEDIRLDHIRAEGSSSQERFEQHQTFGGDTRGHTNS